MKEVVPGMPATARRGIRALLVLVCADVIRPGLAWLSGFAPARRGLAEEMGARYVAICYPVMLVLVIPSTLMLAQSASTRVLFGMAKHKTLAVVMLLEGGANLFLSIFLVRRFGILGDAFGTAMPLACTTLFFLPRHLCRVLKLRIGIYLRHAFLLPLTLCVPLVAVLLLMRHWFVAHNYVQLAIQLAGGSAVYGVGLLWAIWTRKAWQVEGIADQDTADQVAAGLIDTYQQEEI